MLTHPSSAPQALPAQLGVQPQTPGNPPPPQVVRGAAQVPIRQMPPQPSLPPQRWPVQSGVQPQTPG
jgi:hypothetical protein